ncbi:MAG: long-chain fatty acid--CoA ligase [Candidatus Hydrogenedentes bacterium]|nr:long-chain fatty acid--CoA ligase [Candidatus Hydrogenedentota bacterium]
MSLNVAECVTLSAQQTPHAEALVCDDARITFGALLESAQRVAAYLLRSGLQRGDRVALLLPNTPHFPVVYYGVLYAGGVVVPMNLMQTQRELRYLFEDSDPRFVFAWSELAEVAIAALKDATVSPELVVVESAQTPVIPPVGRSFLTELAQLRDIPAIAETQPDDVAVIMYTAAYRGKPLGAQLTHFNLFQNAHTVGSRLLKYTPEDRCLCVLPLFHTFGQCVLMNTALLAGVCVILVPRFDATKILDIVEKERVSTIALVPTMYRFLLGIKPSLSPDLSSLRHVLVGGATMPQELTVAFRERFGITILEGYGLTETSPAVSFNMSEEANRPKSVGLPIWGCEVRIANDNGETLPTGEAGEILARGHNIMKGYWNKPEINAATIKDGWLHTGDLGCLDEDGYIYLKGLKKDMLIRAGLNVYPREVELVLEEHPLIQEAAVVGVPDKVRGEEVQAFVVVTSPTADLEKQLKRHCRELMAGYKCPRYYEILPALPRTSDGMIDKAALRRR